MTKEELFERWINDWSQDYIFTGVADEDKVVFYQDLEDWYDCRHEKELQAITDEIILSMKEMGEAVEAVAEKEAKHRANLKKLSDNTVIHLSTKGRIFDCYD
jgi:hypothetical protein